jgi:starch synthase
MRVAFATSECVPFVKVGGLGDVSGVLPRYLQQAGCEVRVFMPLYDQIAVDDYGFSFRDDLYQIPVDMGGHAVRFNVWSGHLPGSEVEVFLIDCPHYFHRGTAYTDHWDEPARFILLQKAILALLQRFAWAPDVLHSNDWPTALLPAYLRTTYAWDQLFAQTATVLSLHNVGYAGAFDLGVIGTAGLPREETYPGGPLELGGAFSFLKAGLVYIDALSTVSPTYAQEIQTAEYGGSLAGVLRARSGDLAGILNGVDMDEWNPATDPHLPANFSWPDLGGKAACKTYLQDEFGLKREPDTPLVGVVSRFVHQKGLDFFQPILGQLMAQHRVQLAILGSGEDGLERFFAQAAAQYPGRVGFYAGYNNPLAHRIEAGADMFAMPSRYEPCGLNQMYSLRYGTVPVVRKTGGLADTVFDWHETGGHASEVANGFSFYDATPFALYTSLARAIELYRAQFTGGPDAGAWQQLQRRGMAQDFSWSTAARSYLAFYHHALSNRRRGG